jgi:EAL domain-containing protein (putative c-di-GMP-specific phosphodiesterase class I)
VAETSRLIVPIGEWVLREACRHAATWSEQGGYPVGVSVNVSARQLDDVGIVRTVESALSGAHLRPSQLSLEITETALLDDNTATTEILHQLNALGVRLVLDDFGTGYSSLSLLKRVPLAGVKIDRQFVAELPHSRDDRAICQAVIHMARTMRLSVVAEGVETPAQADMLAEMGASLAQGFLFGRPGRASGR